MNTLKFRQENGGDWHYWGYLTESFTSPLTIGNTMGKSYQFTGLHDKNGVEIFTGDIVEYEFEPCGKQRGEFIFDECGYFIKGTNKWRPLKCEIIGNVYQSPELLNNN